MESPDTTSVVLVPGACHGGWWYEPLVTALARHRLHGIAVTLAGLGPSDEVAGVTLDDHVEQVSTVVTRARETSDRVVLVGHSYGGSVITGAADRQPENVDALVYLDAFVPEDGDSCYSMTDDDQRHWYLDGSGRTGLAVDPLPIFDPRARPHPLATLVQKSRLSGGWHRVPVKHYVAATGWPGPSPFAETARRVGTEPGWTVHAWPTRHNVLHDGPERVVELLLGVTRSLVGPTTHAPS